MRSLFETSHIPPKPYSLSIPGPKRLLQLTVCDVG
jgi:hypothetical protein